MGFIDTRISSGNTRWTIQLYEQQNVILNKPIFQIERVEMAYLIRARIKCGIVNRGTIGTRTDLRELGDLQRQLVCLTDR